MSEIKNVVGEFKIRFFCERIGEHKDRSVKITQIEE